MKRYAALDVFTSNLDLLYSALDDFPVTAIEERDDGIRAFFSDAAARDEAHRALAPFNPQPIDVSDDDWAARSQANLEPVTVGRITVAPTPFLRTPQSPSPQVPSPLVITIQPSMGFGTGHHATTRLCLEALQDIDVRNKVVLDVGTGSGVLAIAASRLGAASAVGIDFDEDAIRSANENLALNPEASGVAFEVADLRRTTLPAADVLTANLTGALLIGEADTLLDAVKAGGTVIVSGLMSDERDAVARAFGGAPIIWERHEDEWVGLAVKKP